MVTNPPFSLFREYVAQLVEYNKKFLIIGNQNAIAFKEIFPLIKENKLWLGITMNGSNRWFQAPDKYQVQENAAGYKEIDGKKYFFVNGVTWFTNLPNDNKKNVTLHKHYTDNDYPKYDNYDAIEVSKVAEIPVDYEGIMGVPITFLYKYNPSQFQIIGEANHGSDNEYDLFKPKINGKYIFKRLLIKKK